MDRAARIAFWVLVLALTVWILYPSPPMRLIDWRRARIEP